MRGDRHTIFNATSKAQAAADWMMGAAEADAAA